MSTPSRQLISSENLSNDQSKDCHTARQVPEVLNTTDMHLVVQADPTERGIKRHMTEIS
jgi:hypothetical protein